MNKNSFSFKQFRVFHDKCAMKVGTDGVLLGAWTSIDGTKNVLDIGTGTGLLSLMLSQRNREINVDAIEVDDDASVQAKENVILSPYNSQIKVYNTSFQDFVLKTKSKYDLIVSNPPFFINSLLSDDKRRTKARHSESLTLYDILHLSKSIISDNGVLSFIYPFESLQEILQISAYEGWYVNRRTDVYSINSHSLPKRVLFEFTMYPPKAEVIHDSLLIELARHVYSDEYVALTKEFYINM